MSNLTIINPINASESYTFGNRGKRPKWLTDGLANGTIVVPEGYKSAKDKAAEKVKGPKPGRKPKADTVESVAKRIVKLQKARRNAMNKQEVAQRHLDDAKTVVADLDAEIALATKSQENLKQVTVEATATA